MTIDQILPRFPDSKKTNSGWSGCCPAHDDKTPSLSIKGGDDGGVVLHCHAGCKPEAVVAAVGLTMADLMPARAEPTQNKTETSGKSKIAAVYHYCDEASKILFDVIRGEPKTFRQGQPKEGGGWTWTVKGVRQVPYLLPQLLAHPTLAVVVVEGEKDANALAKLRILATCNSGGAGKWTAEHAEFLRGRTVAVLPDNDEPGRNHAQQVAASLFEVAKSVRIVELPGLPPKGDASDWIASGGTREKLAELFKATPIWTPETAASQPWPEIEPFDTKELPFFPTSVLPTALRHWVEEESIATQTPKDLAGLLSLAVCSAAIARRIEVEPRPGWREPVNLFVSVLLEPGNRKSAVFNDAILPLRQIESELIEAARPSVARQQSDRRQMEGRLEKFEKMAANKGDAEASHKACELAAELAVQVESVLPRLIVDDATSEKIGIMLGEQSGRLASMSPEGGVFDLMAGLYSKSGMPQFGVYLHGHSGDDLITDRVSRKTVRVERPALTCAYAMQPAVIEGLADKSAFRGRGLLARFLYAAPESWIGSRETATEPVCDATREEYCRAVCSLADLQGEHTLRLTLEASEMLKRWERLIEDMLAEGGSMENIRDWGAKLAGATIRLAAVLHCLDHPLTELIDIATISAAIKIAAYLIPHAENVLELMKAKDKNENSQRLDGAQYVLRWIKRKGLSRFTKSEAQHHGKRRFPKADEIDSALADLVERGYIRPRPSVTVGPGRPPSPAYDVNPVVNGTEKPSRGSSNLPVLPDDGICGNIGSAFEQNSDAVSACSAQDEEDRAITLPMRSEYSTQVPDCGKKEHEVRQWEA